MLFFISSHIGYLAKALEIGIVREGCQAYYSIVRCLKESQSTTTHGKCGLIAHKARSALIAKCFKRGRLIEHIHIL